MPTLSNSRCSQRKCWQYPMWLAPGSACTTTPRLNPDSWFGPCIDGVASNARCRANASRRFFVECDVGEIGVQRLVAAEIEHLTPGERDDVGRDQRDPCDIGLHLLLEAVVDRPALGRIDLRLATLEQLVHF